MHSFLFVYVFGLPRGLLDSSQIVVFFFAFVRDVLAKCTDVSDERTLSIFRVTKLVTVNAEVI
jgi:hypothetical protein